MRSEATRAGMMSGNSPDACATAAANDEAVSAMIIVNQWQHAVSTMIIGNQWQRNPWQSV